MKPSDRFKVKPASDSLDQPRNQQPRFLAAYEMQDGSLGTYQNYAADADTFIRELRGLKPVTKVNTLSVTKLEGRYLFVKYTLDVNTYNQNLS